MESKSSSSSPHASLMYSLLRFFPHSITAGRSPMLQTTMQHPSPSLLLVAILLGLAVVSPLATTATFVDCVGDGLYTANSTFEANLRRLAAVLPAETSAKGGNAYRAIGYWPYRVRAASKCYTGSSSSCAACIAGAFKEAERACPYGKKVIVFDRYCNLRLADFTTFSLRSNVVFRRSMIEKFAPVIILQAIGLGWLFFLLLQEWRDKRRGSMMRDSSLPSGDK